MALHQTQDKPGGDAALEPKRQARIEALRKEAERTREFLATTPKRIGSKGKELKSNVTDSESAKMATSKGVMQGYAAQAAVDSSHQVIIAADVIGSGSEQAMLLPMIEQASPYRTPDTLVTADAGYHSDANIAQLMKQNIPAMVADNQMRYRDERFESRDKYKGKPDPLSDKKPTGQEQEVKRFGTVEPVFANLRHNKRLTRLNHRGRAKVNTQWNLYCMVHNIEKLAKTPIGLHKM